MKTWKEWSDEVCAAIKSVPDVLLESAAKEILQADIVIVAGNGGSSSLASHTAQAIAKPDYKAGGGKPAFCLTDNVETLTAHANDGGWSDALVESARPYIETFRCVLILFSSSGKSENIIRLASLASRYKHSIIGFTGFSGGPLRDLSTVFIHVDSYDYEVVEPVHDALLHRMQYYLRTIISTST